MPRKRRTDQMKQSDRRGEEERQKRRNEQTHKWIEARKEIKGIGIDLVADVLLEGFTKGMEGVGLVKVPLDQAKHLFEAIHDTHTANERAATSFGATHALGVIWGDHRNSDNAHIKEGKPYTYSEIAHRVETTFGREKNAHMPSWSVENSDAPTQYQKGVKDATDFANSVLKLGETPAKRKEIIEKATDFAVGVIAKQRMDQSVPSEGF